MVSLLGQKGYLPVSRVTMNVSIHEANSRALALAETLTSQFTQRSKHYAIKMIWFCEQIVLESSCSRLTMQSKWEIFLPKGCPGQPLRIWERSLWVDRSCEHALQWKCQDCVIICDYAIICDRTIVCVLQFVVFIWHSGCCVYTICPDGCTNN